MDGHFCGFIQLGTLGGGCRCRTPDVPVLMVQEAVEHVLGKVLGAFRHPKICAKSPGSYINKI